MGAGVDTMYGDKRTLSLTTFQQHFVKLGGNHLDWKFEIILPVKTDN